MSQPSAAAAASPPGHGVTGVRRLRPIAPFGAIAVLLLFLLSGWPAFSPMGSSSAPLASGVPALPTTATPIALAGTPTLVLSVASGTVQTTVTATGAGFPASVKVNLTWGSHSPGGLLIAPASCASGTLSGGRITTTSSGGFACTFTIPIASPGSYFVTASDSATPPDIATASFVVDWYPAEVESGARFAQSTTIPLANLNARTCGIPATSGVCKASGSPITPYVNASNDPVLNHTSKGLLAMAYTSYTNGTAPCVGARSYSLSNIAFQSSSNDGATWTAPTYLGNPVCSSTGAPNRYPSAWEPALTSLSDGTLVLAYVEYNSTAPSFPPFYNLSASSLSRLVVTESSNGGGTWTTPTVVNVSNPDPSLTVSFPPVRPSITAFGKTIYLTWMSLGRTISPTVTSHVGMIVSTTGGKSWSPTLTLGSATAQSANPNVMVAPDGRLFVAYVTDIYYDYYTGAPVYGDVVVATSTANGTGMTTNWVDYYVTPSSTFGPFFNPAPVLSWTQYGVVDVAYICQQYGNYGQATALCFSSSSDNGSSWSYSYSAFTAFFDPSNVWQGYPNESRILSLAMAPRADSIDGNVILTATVFNGTACVAGHCGVDMQMAVNTSDNGTTWSNPVILSGYVMPNGTNASWRPMLTGEYQSAIDYPAASGPDHLISAGTNASCPSWAAYPKSAVAQCGTYVSSTGATTTLWGTTRIALAETYLGSTATVTFSPVGLPADAAWTLDLMGNVFTSNGSTNLTVTGVPTGIPLLINVTGPGQYNSTYQFRWASSPLPSPAMFSGARTVLETFTAWVPLTIEINPTSLLGQNCQMSGGCSPSYFSPPSYFGDLSNNCITPGNYIGYCSQGCVGFEFDWNNYPYNSNYFTELGFEYEQVGCADSFISHSQSGQPTIALSSGATVYIPSGKPYNLSVTHWSPLDQLCGASTSNRPTLPPVPSSNYAYYWMECFNIYIAELQLYSWFGSGSGNTTSTSANITVSPTGPVTETANFGIVGACQGSSSESYAYAYNHGNWNWYGPYNNTVCGPISTGGGGIQVPLQITESGLPAGVTWGVTLSSGNTSETANTSSQTLTLNDLYLGSTYAIAVATIPTATAGVYWVGTTNATVTLPRFQPLTVTFTKRTLTGLNFLAMVTEDGLPTGSGWSLTAANASGSQVWTNPPGWTTPTPVLVNLAGGVSYGFNGSAVYASNGTAYYVRAVNVTFASINSTAFETAPGTSITAIGLASVVLEYTPVYWLTVLSNPGGTATPSNRWVVSGASVTLTAQSSSGFRFSGWTGYGNGSRNSVLASITITPGGPVTEIANFRPVPPVTFNITVQATGLSAGTTFSLTLNGQTYSGNGSFVVTNVSQGTYDLSAPTVYSSPVANERWVPTGLTTTNGAVTGPVTIASDLTVTVTYAVQYLLVVSSTVGGTINGPTGSPWYDPEASVSLMAMPTAGPPGVGYYFVTWNGTGLGSTTATTPTISVTMSGPVSELAQFALRPIPPPRSYILTVTESGLPTGVGWNVTLGSVGNSSTSPTLSIGRLNGSYTVSVPIVYGAAGVRYVPTPATQPTAVTANATVTVTFATQYLVTVSVSGGGNASPGTEWVANGQQLTLVATAEPGWSFASWNGTQATGNASVSVVVSGGPVTETATFVPAYHPVKTTDQLQGAPIALGLLGALLVAGFAIVFLLSRRRGPGPSVEPEPAVEPLRDGMSEESGEPAEAAESTSDEPVDAGEP